MADNVWTPVGASTDGEAVANWSLGWKPKAGDTMVFDGAVSNNDCTFAWHGVDAADAVRTDNGYSGKVTSPSGWHIAGDVDLDFAWELSNSSRYLRVGGKLTLGSNADLHGVGYLYIYVLSAGDGITSFDPSARIRCDRLYVQYLQDGGVLAAGNYECDWHIQVGYAAARTLTLAAGNYTIDGLTLTANAANGDLTLDVATNNPTVTVEGNLVIDIDNTGDVILDASSNALTVQGDIVDEITGAGSFTAHSQDLDLTGTNDQDVDGCGGTWGDVEINKTAGTVTASGDWIGATMHGTDGTLDPNGHTFQFSSDVDWGAGFDFAAEADALNGCDWQVGGNFSADGQTLKATAAWTLTVTGSAMATGVTVAHSDASGGTEIEADDGTCTDAGNNVNWSFQQFVGWGLAVQGIVELIGHAAGCVRRRGPMAGVVRQPGQAAGRVNPQ